MTSYFACMLKSKYAVMGFWRTVGWTPFYNYPGEVLHYQEFFLGFGRLKHEPANHRPAGVRFYPPGTMDGVLFDRCEQNQLSVFESEV